MAGAAVSRRRCMPRIFASGSDAVMTAAAWLSYIAVIKHCASPCKRREMACVTFSSRWCMLGMLANSSDAVVATAACAYYSGMIYSGNTPEGNCVMAVFT